MKKFGYLLLSLALSGALGWLGGTTIPERPVSASPPVSLQEAYGRMEISFEANRGQADSSVGFLSRGAGYSLFLKPNEAVFSLSNAKDPSHAKPVDASANQGDGHAAGALTLRLELLGSNADAKPTALAELPGTANYFIGDDPAKWQTDVPTYGRVRYSDVYKGVDIEYYGNQRQLEYDFRVAPGADYRQIALKFTGANSLKIDDETGDLLINAAGETVRQRKPVVYQQINEERQKIEGGFILDTVGNVAFEIGLYDTSQPLIIDPVLVYSTYLGGSADEYLNAIALDASGNVYVTGYTTSTNFPTVNAIQGPRGFQDVFVTKINAGGTSIDYSTYLGGDNDDSGNSIAVDSDGNAYLTGLTFATNFPTKNALQSVGSPYGAAFAAKIDPTGSALVYSTYLGYQSNGTGITVDSAGNAYVGGWTQSAQFPTTPNAFQRTVTVTDGFVTKIDPTGSSLLYSTLIGGNSEDKINGIAVDADGNAYVTGTELSSNFPTTQGAIESNPPSFGPALGFVTKFNPSGSALIYSSYLRAGSGNAIAVDAGGNAYIAGYTGPELSTFNAIQSTPGGGLDAFVMKINAFGSAFVYSTYLGGNDQDWASGIALDPSGNCYITGHTRSKNFPLSNSMQPFGGGSYYAATDAFVTKINAAGTSLAYSTYLGGTVDDFGVGITVDPNGDAYVAGRTNSPDLPTVNPVRTYSPGPNTPFDGFVTKIRDVFVATPTPTPTVTPTPGNSGRLDPSYGNGGKVAFSLTNATGALGAALEPDGKLVLLANVTGADGYPKVGVVRLNSNGSLDTTFGNGGVASVDFSVNTRHYPFAITVQTDGRILIVGTLQYFAEIDVARLNTNGSLDSTFGSGGRQRISLPAGPPQNPTVYRPTDVVVQTDGKILIPGRRLNATPPSYLIRLTPAGQLDGSFNGSGILYISQGNSNGSTGEFIRVAVQPDGRIVDVGHVNSDFAVLRFNSDGSTDTGFGNGGMVVSEVAAIAGGYDKASSVALQPDGRIVVGGTALFTDNYNRFVNLVRFTSNGVIDPTFGSNGKITFDSVPIGFLSIGSILIQPDGKILTVGTSYPYGSFSNGGFAIARVDQAGVLDHDFGLQGIIQTTFGNTSTEATGAVLQSDNKLIVAGQSIGDGFINIYSFATARYLLYPTAAPTPSPTPTPTPTPSPTPTPPPSIVLEGPDGSGLNDGGSPIDFGPWVVGQQPFKTFTIKNVGPSTLHLGGITQDGPNYSYFVVNDNDLSRTIEPGGSTTFKVYFTVARGAVGRLNAAIHIENDDPNKNPFDINVTGLAITPRKFDFDGDGKTDVASYRPSNGNWYINQSRDGFLGQNFGASTDKLAPADYDGDGKTDVAVYRPSTGVFYIYNSRDGSDGSAYWGLAEDIPAPGDFDGDGMADVAVFRPSTGTWWIRQSASGNAALAVQYGASGDQPVVGDYDGDGKADVAVYRPSTGVWYMRRSSGGDTALQFGVSGDKVVPADYDGDGKTDVAVYRTQTGLWFIVNSTGGYTSYQFGYPTDIPAPGDYDGDGKTDMAVFRPSEGNFWINGTTSGVQVIGWGQNGDVPIENAYVR